MKQLNRPNCCQERVKGKGKSGWAFSTKAYWDKWNEISEILLIIVDDEEDNSRVVSDKLASKQIKLKKHNMCNTMPKNGNSQKGRKLKEREKKQQSKKLASPVKASQKKPTEEVK